MIKTIFKMLNKIRKRFIYGYRAYSDDYIKHLRNRGMIIGERVNFFSPTDTEIDETRPWMIEIGNDVQITRGVTILSHGYEWSVIKGKYGNVLGSSGKVIIGNNVFLGVNAIVLKGTHIGNNVIIGAGSVVCGDIPDDCVAAGNPAKVICTINEYFSKRERLQKDEAIELVNEYRKIYHKEPSESILCEFFWLFTNSESNIPKCWDDVLKLVGNYEVSVKCLNGTGSKKHQKQFSSFNDFLRNI